MSAADPVVTNFHPKRMRRDVIAYFVSFLLYCILAFQCLPWIFNGTMGWVASSSWLFVLVCNTTVMLLLQLRIRHYCCRKPAFVVTKSGIEEYASLYKAGQLSWEEIERMSCRTRDRRLVSNRFFRTPIRGKEKVLVIELKPRSQDEATATNGTIAKLTVPQRYRPKYIVIPEWCLDTPVRDVVQKLNAFYIANVRNAGIA